MRSSHFLVALPLLVAGNLAAQQPLPGYAPAAATAQRAAEADAIRRPDPARASAHSRELTREVHIAGTPAQARVKDYIMREMRALGLETELRTYEVWMPHTTEVRAWRVSPNQVELDLREGAVPGDTTIRAEQEAVIANGYSGAGDVTAEVVFVNFGLIEDYARLDSMGISVKGRIAIARYGRSFRGIKAREAERRGAVALIMFSDPQDDGYVRGQVYPEGPMRPATGIQRGSVMNGLGDPSTPMYASVPGARRIPLDSMPVPRIPVIPMSYGNATELLRGVRGVEVPTGWQGGLPFRYHVGPGPVQARVRVVLDSATAPFKPVHVTLARIRGTEFPDEMVIIGGHSDAWGHGAADNASGMVSVLEAARAVGEQARAGRRPKRTIVFATWDGEEWGLIGSTEYVEDDSQRLLRGAVAYLNQDVAAQGRNFGGGGSPSLRSTLRDVARQVEDPDGQGSVYAVWRARTGVADGVEPPMGDPGGGSDFAGFYNHLGIPISNWGFGGSSGIYHSLYDSYHWMNTFGDPGFRYHATAARISAAMALRLANADVIPYDYVEYARTMRRYLAPMDQAFRARGWQHTSEPLAAAIERMERAALAFEATRDTILSRGSPPRATRLRVNTSLLGVERALTRPEGLRTRPWYRNLIYAADENDGYGNMVFPSVNEAIRAGDSALAGRELADLVSRFDAATAAIERARAAFTTR